MTKEKTITGKLDDLQRQVLAGTITIPPDEHMKWILKTRGIDVSEDCQNFKTALDDILKQYYVCRDKKVYNTVFECMTGMTFEQFLNDCLGGYING